MNAIGMYMTGNSLQIFSIMMVFMLFKAPIQALFDINATFAKLETENNRTQMLGAKAAFVGCNLLALALGMWKVNGMGLLPCVHDNHVRRGEKTLLTWPTGLRGRTGWLGRRRGSRWRGRIMSLHDDDGCDVPREMAGPSSRNHFDRSSFRAVLQASRELQSCGTE